MVIILPKGILSIFTLNSNKILKNLQEILINIKNLILIKINIILL